MLDSCHKHQPPRALPAWACPCRYKERKANVELCHGFSMIKGRLRPLTWMQAVRDIEHGEVVLTSWSLDHLHHMGYAYVRRWVDAVDGWMDGWMDRRIDGWCSGLAWAGCAAGVLAGDLQYVMQLLATCIGLLTGSCHNIT